MKRVTEKKDPDNPSEPSLHLKMDANALACVYDCVRSEVIHKGKVVKLKDLKNLYNNNVSTHNKVNEVTSNHFRRKLESHPEFTDIIDFSSSPYKETLIFCKSTENMKSTVRSAYELGTTDWAKEVSHELREQISTAFRSNESLPWPTRAQDLPEPIDEIPSKELAFILSLICGDSVPNECSKKLALSISQDICRAVTRGQWKMKKHVLLCMTLRHLFRSKSIISLLNKLGLCESYTFSLELETALANEIVQSASLISNSDVVLEQPEGAVFHNDWDNFG